MSDVFAGIVLATLFLADHTCIVSCVIAKFVQFHLFRLVYNLTMNRLTNEERLQIIELYCQNSRSV